MPRNGPRSLPRNKKGRSLAGAYYPNVRTSLFLLILYHRQGVFTMKKQKNLMKLTLKPL